MIRILLCILLQLSFVCCFAQLQGKVVAIADGDTFTILTSEKNQIKIRLYGIDAPERKQPYSTQAKNYLSQLIFGKNVQIEPRYKDRYGRNVGITWVGKVNVNETLLKGGYAWHFKQYDKSSRWAKMEAEARVNKRGLWSEPAPVPPWNWRNNKVHL